MSGRDVVVRRHLSSAIDDLPIDVDGRLSELRRGGGRRPTQHRLAAIIVALAVAVMGLAFAGRAFIGAPGSAGSGDVAQPILFVRTDVVPDSLAYFRYRIWSVRVDGTHAQPLLQPSGNNSNAVWSPDGTRIAFVGHEDPPSGPVTLWVMNADGSGRIALTDDFGVDAPSWSPDGEEIAFMGQQDPDPTGETDGPTGIWIVPASGGEPRLVLEGQHWEAPSWSPDGTRLAVTRWDGDVIDLSEGGISNIYTVGIDGSGQTRLTNDGAFYYGPSWSPDGTRILATRSETYDDWNQDLYVMDADGSDLQRLTDWKGWDTGGIWSPDGTEILFASDRGATPEEQKTRGMGGVQGMAIYVMDADGSKVRPVFDDGAMQDVPTSWRP